MSGEAKIFYSQQKIFGRGKFTAASTVRLGCRMYLCTPRTFKVLMYTKDFLLGIENGIEILSIKNFCVIHTIPLPMIIPDYVNSAIRELYLLQYFGILVPRTKVVLFARTYIAWLYADTRMVFWGYLEKSQSKQYNSFAKFGLWQKYHN